MTPIEQARRVLLGEARYACILGDGFALAREMGDGDVDLVIGDPPYDEKTHAGARTTNGGNKSPIDFAALPPVSTVLPQLLHCAKRWVVLFCAQRMFKEYEEAAGDAWIRDGLWVRTNSMPQQTGDRPGQGAEGIAIMHRTGASDGTAAADPQCGRGRSAPTPRGNTRPKSQHGSWRL